MRFVNYLNRLRSSLRRRPQDRRPQKCQSRLSIEQLEDRMVPSTLSVDLAGNAQFLATPAIAHNITVSERLILVDPVAPQSPIPLHFVLERVITDTADKITVTGPGASRFGGSGTNQVFTLQSINSLVVDLFEGSDTVNVQAIDYATTVRHGGHGVDTVNVGQAGSVSGIQGALTAEEGLSPFALGSTHLVIDDSADPTPRLVTIGTNSIQFSGSAPIIFGLGVSSVDVFGGNSDTFVEQTGSSTTPVAIHGGPGASTLVSGAGVNNWIINGINAGSLHNVSFVNVQNLRGGPASSGDLFHVINKAGVTGNIVGAPSALSLLDYSSYTTQVIVDLKLDLALAGGITTHVFNIRDVFGGQGNNILVGDHDNLLRGGAGRDILISGGGATTLQAGAGEALMIGAHYVFDTNLVALNKLMAEWSFTYSINPLLDYQVRVNHLVNGGGLNGPFVLNKATVFQQAGVTQLVSGGQFDFYVFDLGDIFAPRPGEISAFL